MKILFLHTLASNITLFKPLAATSLPKHDIFHDVQESFLSNIRKTGPTPSIVKQIQGYLNHQLTQGYDFIVCTCSTLGPIVDAYPDNRVFRVDRPMAEQTIDYSRILVAVTLESTIEPTRSLLESSNNHSQFEFLFIPAAWEHYVAGSMLAFNSSIANTITEHRTHSTNRYDAIVLAQASMAYALAECQFDITVLSSPQSCLNYLEKQLE
ncbi:hypothetical protein VSAK1_20644 [Vibrio mediterranei AK1]|uniref:hypothetical protein n=1 Tax=Vibrio mediterranei TaxID=689 RepID=UPI0001540856|nr:hypothetical protein [Vibrio mediterranei]EDL54604.1 hypothetical protein VSAK1_20644 [Vibrio mediterranei AK1]